MEKAQRARTARASGGTAARRGDHPAGNGAADHLANPAPSKGRERGRDRTHREARATELDAEEAVRTQLGRLPRPPADAERVARTLATLAQTLHALQRLRCGAGAQSVANDYDDMPEDIDEFRRNLARRIELFVESRLGKERMALDRQFATLTDDELKELSAVGRERGMQALLPPPVEKEGDEGTDEDAMQHDVVHRNPGPFRIPS